MNFSHERHKYVLLINSAKKSLKIIKILKFFTDITLTL